jgi:hypothetical protein
MEGVVMDVQEVFILFCSYLDEAYLRKIASSKSFSAFAYALGHLLGK